LATDSLAKQQKTIDRLQQETDYRIFIGTTSAAGTGNNPTAASWAFFLGQP